MFGQMYYGTAHGHHTTALRQLPVRNGRYFPSIDHKHHEIIELSLHSRLQRSGNSKSALFGKIFQKRRGISPAPASKASCSAGKT